jgi:RNA polymerase sigma-70 factor (ECF subfamily)
MGQLQSGTATRASIFLQLRAEDRRPREIAWQEFNDRYGPIIRGFARRMGAAANDADDIVQEVLTGFFAVLPTFAYDASRGRFRGYLKACTVHAMHRKGALAAAQRRVAVAKSAERAGLAHAGAEQEVVDRTWDEQWQRELLKRALADLRRDTADSRTFRAFELCLVFEKSPQQVADQLGMHLGSVYRARQQLTSRLRERLIELSGDD